MWAREEDEVRGGEEGGKRGKEEGEGVEVFWTTKGVEGLAVRAERESGKGKETSSTRRRKLDSPEYFASPAVPPTVQGTLEKSPQRMKANGGTTASA